ncbi:TPA: hypothetical protein RWI92_002995 [Staphylococcus aureus]|uniref:hypothetical protein n=1 Tax=Staphylococcus aureus TaxID=1280 RepID=UPI0010FBBE96|nr:hypothetical protein [Staphylococcus aureus]EIB2248365.1 hypothetical protein [Staphylococcus aureus]EIB2248656.1 hypothetical protein [Staphylococcus aureus]MBK3937258.1 hypothetical protein [Staphylococcus aureus]MBK3944594.1 hypothetical protein [Staphylococcus aureus]MBK3962174.1 hypothetical protein [Staphylococcus aureus]
MEKEFDTMTYGTLPLQLDVKKGIFLNKGIPVKAVLDLETGEVTFKVSDKDLEEVRKLSEKE